VKEIRRDVFPFVELEIWQHAVGLADFVLELLDAFPPNRHLLIIGQEDISSIMTVV
jgi:hypothetical protein